MKKIQPYIPHILAVFGFILIALFYFYPVLEGKEIYQSDIAQYKGMAKEQSDFRKEQQAEPYWTNSAFGGMPTYQLGAKYPHNYIKKLDVTLRFLPRPADYLFLYFIGGYLLLIVLKIDPLKAFIGALAFGFSTYLIIILGVGHNAKAHAIAYMPMVLSGVLLVFKKRYWVGGVLTAIAAALEIQANHFQMTYYLLFLLLIVGLFFTIQLIKQKELSSLAKIIGVLVLSAILAIGANATSLLATSEYANFSTRSKSELTIQPDGTEKTDTEAMSYNYITEYSYGKAESLNLLVPRLFGGSNAEALPSNSEMHQFLLSQGIPASDAVKITKQMPTYWGNQPIVAAPAYIGIVVFFFFIIALLLPEKKYLKFALLTGIIVSLLLSWGKNLNFLTQFFVDYVPLYNKFRAVSSIQVIIELCTPVLATLGMYQFFTITDKKVQMNYLKKASYIVLGILLALFVGKGLFTFSGANDAYFNQVYGADFMRALREDRATMYQNDVIRAFGFVMATIAMLFLYVKNKLKSTTAVVAIGILLVSDLFFIAKNYVNTTDFVASEKVQQPFSPTAADKQILKDTTHFRVFEAAGSMSNARTSYFHQSIGGYHAAKPRRIQQLYDFYITPENNKSITIFNMLNVKYVINTNEENIPVALLNPNANGAAWFVSELKTVNAANEEILALEKLNTQTTAVIQKEKAKKITATKFTVDSLASIQLVNYQPNKLEYTTTNKHNGLAVFSEIYYPHGWKATCDGKELPIYNVDYVLRAIEIPKGNHKIVFTFQPEVIAKGSVISLFSCVALFIFVLLALFFNFKNKKQ